MRITTDPSDPDFVQGHVTVLFNDLFFNLGPVIEADEGAGRIKYFPLDDRGNYRYDPSTAQLAVAVAEGKVRIFTQFIQC